MCGRYTLTDPDPRILRMRFELPDEAEIEGQARFNVAPTDAVLAVRAKEGVREAGRLRWGLVPPGLTAERIGRPLINARAESVDRQPAFREAFAERRCLIPADGFYEWQRTESGKRPIWISRPGAELFAFAGLWAQTEAADGSELHSCTIVTCEPSEQIRPVHDRMPVILPAEAEAGWLDPEREPSELRELLRAFQGELELREVPDLVNDVRNDGPELIEAAKPPMQLF